MGKVDPRPPVEEGPNISSMNLSDADDTPAGGGVMKEESMKMILNMKEFYFMYLNYKSMNELFK